MKKIIAATLLASCVAGPAFGAGEGFYAGINVGRTSTNITSNLPINTKSTEIGVLAGYQFDKNWAVEAEYTGAGKFVTTPANLNGKVNALSLSAVGTWSMSDTFALYGKLGLARTSTSVSSVPAGSVLGKNRTGLNFGLGLQYNVTPTIGIRAGYDRYDAEIAGPAVTGSKFSNNKWSVGTIFKF